MIISFNKDRDDFKLERKEYCNNINLKLNGIRIIKKVFFHISIVSIFFMMLIISIKYNLNWYSFLVAFVISIISKYVFKISLNSFQEKALKDANYLGSYKIILDEDGIKIIKSNSEVFTKWECIENIKETKNYLFLTTNYDSYISIPKSYVSECDIKNIRKKDNI
ncbi:hypothetical protein N072000002_p10230 (plasmid) [Clostridium tetani]|uniref:YcxB-like C-terminal domain-containing protein n=1 Tax=Clostridium tetani TaxID=1513 RepID=A0A4Q0VAY6_CLOTA|nr:YcxB family protein [Clostridium tetani]RXI44278.1 hypothetical protein DP130_13440 [Clostridium tetani]BDR82464.1 hypothetical protein K234311028_p10230 [Clostridium tetani]BDR90854.1 hypothetical protein N072000002_p10230 [Clostridium tetani]